MRNRCKLFSLVIILVLLVGCGTKEETKVDTQASAVTQQETETSKTMPSVETEEVIVEEASKGEDINYEQLHTVTLDKIYAWIEHGGDGTVISDGEQAILDAIQEFGDDANYDLGYAIEEVNEDGIPELVIGKTTQEGIGNMIYAIYTWKDGNFGCNVEGAEYTQIYPGTINEAQELYLTPFAHYDYVGGANADVSVDVNEDSSISEEPPVCAQWIEDVYLEPNGYEVFTADDLAEQRQVVFIAIYDVTDFKVLALEYEDVDADGNVRFATETLYSQDELTPQCPLMVGMSCDSTIPCYGISYVDENGVARNFAVEVSGMDGSILLSEF